MKQTQTQPSEGANGEAVQTSNIRIVSSETTPTPATPIDIVFQNLTYSVTAKSKQKASLCSRSRTIQIQILKGVTGMIQHGKITAIMGASGAGKTSLLNILACRIRPNRKANISGEVFSNFRPYTYKEFGEFANYVMQQDYLLETLTVRETLMFAASLSLNKSKQERNEIIGNMLREFKLEKCADTVVGGSDTKGISGGQMRRTSVAFELISDPQVIFLDEPTSGLDSLTTFVIVRYLKRITTQGNKTVVMTIHQPGSQTYSLFDDLILMIEGKLVYQGACTEAVDYFTQLGCKCPEYSNPPDYFLSIMHHESSKNVVNFPRYFATYDQQLAPRVKQAIDLSERREWVKRKTSAGFCHEIGTLMWREGINFRRNPKLLISRVVEACFITFVIATFFWRLGDDYSTEEGLKKSFVSKSGYFFVKGFTCFLGRFGNTVLTFPSQKVILAKQHSSKLYSVLAYFVTVNLINFTINSIMCLLTAFVQYWTVDLRSGAEHFLRFFFFSILVTHAGNCCGLFFSTLFKTIKLISMLVPCFFMPIMITAGYFFKNQQDIPKWFRWTEFLTPLKYSMIMFCKNEFQGTAAPIYLLHFDISMWLSVGLLIILMVATSTMAYFALAWRLKKPGQ